MSKLFGIRLKNLRQGKNLSQRGMAQALEVSQRIISNWENGEAVPSNYKLSKIAEFFNIPIVYFYGWDEETINALRTLNKTLNEKLKEDNLMTPDILETEHAEIINTEAYEKICNIKYSKETFKTKAILLLSKASGIKPLNLCYEDDKAINDVLSEKDGYYSSNGEKLKQIRLILKLTQKEFADILKDSQTLIERLEEDLEEMEIDIVMKLADLLNHDIDYFFPIFIRTY